MTNEEAILMLERIMYDEDNHGIEWAAGAKQTFEMAISALEKQDVPDTNVGDTISRQAAIDALSHMCSEDENGITVSRANVNSMLRVLPSAQPERKKGKWIRTRTVEHDGELYCDQCGQEHPEQKLIWNYCPNCGVDMKGEQ